jgi:hypothetical protein
MRDSVLVRSILHHDISLWSVLRKPTHDLDLDDVEPAQQNKNNIAYAL